MLRSEWVCFIFEICSGDLHCASKGIKQFYGLDYLWPLLLKQMASIIVMNNDVSDEEMSDGGVTMGDEKAMSKIVTKTKGRGFKNSVTDNRYSGKVNCVCNFLFLFRKFIVFFTVCRVGASILSPLEKMTCRSVSEPF